MNEPCCCPDSAGRMVCELPPQEFERPAALAALCPRCAAKGKRVQGQTPKALLAVSLRELRDTQYLFCKTRDCPVVYFSSDGTQVFTTSQVRERVYQKEPENAEVFVCYCFRHSAGVLRGATVQDRHAILTDINAGIDAGQCACDLRNPQGSCCLGNVRELVKRLSADAMPVPQA